MTAPLLLTLALLGVALAASLVVLRRTVRERDRIELLHWTGMEAVRTLAELGARTGITLDEKISCVLEHGRSHLDMEIGIASRVKKGRYEILGIRAPEMFPVTVGGVFTVEETHCQAALAAERPVVFERAPEGEGSGHTAFSFQSYIGCRVRVGDEVYGTLGFGSLAPRRRPFTATEKDVVQLMAQWLGTEIERGAWGQARLPGPARWREIPVDRGVDLNAVLRRLDARLRELVQPPAALEISLAPALESAHAPRLPLETVVRTLVQNAREAMLGTGRLRVATANLEIARSKPGARKKLEPERYVTLSVRTTGSGVDAEALSNAFESGAGEQGAAEGRLSLVSVQRMLRRCGGDLSIDVEPGRSASITVFLPLAESPALKSEPVKDDEASPPRAHA